MNKLLSIKEVYIFQFNKLRLFQRYETLSQKMLSFINKVVQAEIKENNLKNHVDSSYSLFLQKHFSEIWDNTEL